ncbi:MAG: hypothetical protein K2M94_05420 [Paramuribaculum sp.]|nr:hypothetical protein [Paramuribaculum sp.]
MKKISLIGLSLMSGLFALAQADAVKHAEHIIKSSNPDFVQAKEVITPALTNPETAETMMPWYLAGKANIGIYEAGYMQESLGNPMDAAQKKVAGHALIDAFNQYYKAMHLDSIPNEKGKIKPKKSKEMIKELAGLYPQIRNAGIFLIQAQDYNGAYDAWEIYAQLPGDARLGKEAPTADPDTILGETCYYQGAAMLAAKDGDYKKALNKLEQAEAYGYAPIEVYVYATEAARLLNDSTTMLEYAQKGYDKFGTQEISFVGQIINSKLAKNDYDECYRLIDEAISNTPEGNAPIMSQLYTVKGNLLDQQEKYAEAEQCFDKSIQYDDKNAKAYFDKARMIYNAAVRLDEEANNAQSQEVKDQLLKAAEYFEKAYNLDEVNMTQIPNILYRLYYRLGAGYETQADVWKNM